MSWEFSARAYLSVWSWIFNLLYPKVQLTEHNNGCSPAFGGSRRHWKTHRTWTTLKSLPGELWTRRFLNAVQKITWLAKFPSEMFWHAVNFALEQSGQIAEIVVIAWHQFSHPFVKKMKISAIQNEMVEWRKRVAKVSSHWRSKRL